MVAIGILGTGKIAERAILGPAVSVPDVQIVAVGSRSVERARSYAEEHGLGSWGGYEDLLSDPLVDVVYVTLPPTLHADWAIRALEAGKHVLCEKPLAAVVGDIRPDLAGRPVDVHTGHNPHQQRSPVGVLSHDTASSMRTFAAAAPRIGCPHQHSSN